MKYLEIYEEFNNTRFQKGDIVVCIKNYTYNLNRFLSKDKKYIVNDVSLRNKIEVRDFETKKIMVGYFPNDYFLSEEDWKISQDAKRYNL